MAYHFTEGLAFERKEETEDEFNVDLFQTKAQHANVGNWEESRTYYMDDSELCVVSYEKDLGVWMSALLANTNFLSSSLLLLL